MAALLAGQKAEEIARQFNMPIGTVKTWKHQQDHAGESPVSASDTQKGEIGALLVKYLSESLETLAFQQRTIFRDPEWLKQQDASELAVLHGVCTDKATRLIEALERAVPVPEPEPEATA